MLNVYAEVISQAAFDIAWKSLTTFTRLSEPEMDSAPDKLREYIDALVSSGERDKEKIAQCALGMIREYQQIARSFFSLNVSPSISP